MIKRINPIARALFTLNSLKKKIVPNKKGKGSYNRKKLIRSQVRNKNNGE